MGEDGRVENGLARGSWRTPDASDTDVCAVLGSYNTVNLAEGTPPWSQLTFGLIFSFRRREVVPFRDRRKPLLTCIPLTCGARGADALGFARGTGENPWLGDTGNGLEVPSLNTPISPPSTGKGV